MLMKKIVKGVTKSLFAPVTPVEVVAPTLAEEALYQANSSFQQSSINYGYWEIPNNAPKKPMDNALKTSPTSRRMRNNTPKLIPKTLRFLQGSEGYERSVYWCIKNYIPTNSLGLLYAPSAFLKSFVAIDLACSVAEGVEWCGNKVSKGAVLYVAAEGALGTSRRIRGWEIQNKRTVRNLFVLDHAIYLTSPEDMSSLQNAIKMLEESNGIKFDLIVLDTLARTFIGDENTQQDMSKFITACDSLKTEVNCSILLVHHTGKDASKGARGSSALRAACDCEFQVQRIDGSTSVNVICTKQKDDEEAKPIKLDFETVLLDIFDEEHNELETLVKINHSTQSPTIGSKLANEILEHIEAQPQKKTTRRMLREFLYPNKARLEDKERKQIQRALKVLLGTKKIMVTKLDTKPQDCDEIRLAD
ncbi:MULTISPECIES: helicase RepA family protein [Vibrio]|uniref:AAA family ATPase n=1 Tax=Vibrio alginolyticus TaxID=663 RepID=A0A7Y0R019_VIBAL|nr:MULTISPECIES: helicase RepA family protein [Vibrio]EJR0680642.1 AAA family ATPase [Vibrio parahaemolyticus]ALR93424.1 hypothetical protein AT730_14135 [Vibrio alginolyticus]MBY7707221.1 AAA family ATPase [Vibrio alginolyticus]MDW2202663.1 helicase RepA family protein [Vibrio sp. 1636]NMR74619.1 AAA family ATPase [Vibrio alginolyticus]